MALRFENEDMEYDLSGAEEQINILVLENEQLTQQLKKFNKL